MIFINSSIAYGVSIFFNHEKYGGTFDKWLLVDGWLVKHLGLFICLVKTGKINITELGMDERLGKTPE